MFQCLLFEDVLCHCWSYLLIGIVIDHDVNIATMQCFSGCLSKISNFHAEKFDVPHIAPK